MYCCTASAKFKRHDIDKHQSFSCCHRLRRPSETVSIFVSMYEQHPEYSNLEKQLKAFDWNTVFYDPSIRRGIPVAAEDKYALHKMEQLIHDLKNSVSHTRAGAEDRYGITGEILEGQADGKNDRWVVVAKGGKAGKGDSEINLKPQFATSSLLFT